MSESDPMDERPTLERALTEFFEPVRLAAADPYPRGELLRSMGWNPEALPFEALPNAFDRLFTASDELLVAVSNPPSTLQEYLGLLSAVGDLFAAIEDVQSSVESLGSLTEEDVAQFGTDLITVLVNEYVQSQHPTLEQLAWILTIYQQATLDADAAVETTPLRTSAPAAEIAFEQLGKLMTDPGLALREAYFGSAALDDLDVVREGMSELLPRISALLDTIGIDSAATTRFSEDVTTGTETVTDLDIESTALPASAEPVGALTFDLEAPAVDTGDGNTLSTSFRLSMVFYFDTAAEEFSVVLDPSGSATHSLPLGSWTLVFQASAEVPGLAITPDDVVLEGSEEGELDIGATARKEPSADSQFAYLVGGADSTRLEVGSFEVGAGTQLSIHQQRVQVLARAAGASFVIAPGDGGGFLATVLPKEGIRTDFDLGVGWDSDRGVHIEGAGSLRATLPIHQTLFDIITIDTIDVAVRADTDSPEIPVDLGITSSLSIGPIDATIQNVGLRSEFSFPEDQQGDLGPVDVDLGFKPPSGIGLSIDAGPVTGGGFLSFDPDRGLYAGTLELQIGKLGITAVGLLQTPLPDGSDGYSLLIIITAEFPPVTLPYGFTLNGLGGILGVHRDVRAEPLGDAVRAGRIGSVLFPENVVARATQIISDLGSFFPPTQDVHLFGPMAKFGWGVPTLITFDIGVMVSIPTWKIVLLGRIQMVLPDSDLALVSLKFAVVGVLDIPGQRLSIDAAIYDSRIGPFTLSGTMALRLNWGADPQFLVSIGGFHPRYNPPKTFPELDRVRATLAAPSGNPGLEMNGYVATTPNSFQVGAGVHLHADAGPASVSGELSFDALFQFDPFKFVVDFAARLTFRLAGSNFGINVNGTLSGPQPLRVQGRVTIEVVFVSVSVDIDVSIGSKRTQQALPPADVLTPIHRELTQAGNWSAQLPTDGPELVRFVDDGSAETSPAPETKPVRVHPLGTITVRQTVVPLETSIETYGNAKPIHDHFMISDFSVPGSSLPEAGEARERFAIGQFRRLTDSQKLQSESFEQLLAGKRIESEGIYVAGADTPELVSLATLEFETTVIDESEGNYRLTGDDLPLAEGEAALHPDAAYELSKGGNVATAETRTTGQARYAGPDQSISLTETQYVVVHASDLSLADEVTPNPASGQTEVEARDALEAFRRTHPESDSELRVVATHERNTET